MPNVLASLLTLALLLSGSCGAQPSASNNKWSLTLTTSGGFAGIGTGNLSADSDGNFKYDAPSPPRGVHKGCSGKLSAQQLRPISDAVTRANPKDWNRPDLKVAAPDAFGYKLELRTGSNSQTITVQWYDNTREQLPDDLKQLSDALLAMMKTACNPRTP